jgi:hypothetical protein
VPKYVPSVPKLGTDKIFFKKQKKLVLPPSPFFMIRSAKNKKQNQDGLSMSFDLLD